jgi:hypothetical protein
MNETRLEVGDSSLKYFSGLRSGQFVFLELVPRGAFQEPSGRL